MTPPPKSGRRRRGCWRRQTVPFFSSSSSSIACEAKADGAIIRWNAAAVWGSSLSPFFAEILPDISALFSSSLVAAGFLLLCYDLLCRKSSPRQSYYHFVKKPANLGGEGKVILPLRRSPLLSLSSASVKWVPACCCVGCCRCPLSPSGHVIINRGGTEGTIKWPWPLPRSARTRSGAQRANERARETERDSIEKSRQSSASLRPSAPPIDVQSDSSQRMLHTIDCNIQNLEVM